MVWWLTGTLVFRFVWSIPTAWQLYRKWNAPVGHPCRHTLYQQWQYAMGLSEMLIDEDYISPSDAISEDRHYWSE